MRQIKFKAWDNQKEVMITSKKNSITFDGKFIPNGYGLYNDYIYAFLYRGSL